MAIPDRTTSAAATLAIRLILDMALLDMALLDMAPPSMTGP